MGDAERTLVGTSVLEENNLSFLKVETSLLSDEEIRAFHDVLEVGDTFGVDKLCNIGDIDGLRSDYGVSSRQLVH
jgi:hypothetical protein